MDRAPTGTRQSARLAEKRMEPSTSSKSTKSPAVVVEPRRRQPYDQAFTDEFNHREANRIFNAFFGMELTRLKRTVPYFPQSTRERLFVRQQMDRERRRYFLTQWASNKFLFFQFKSYFERLLYNQTFRFDMAKSVVEYIDNNSRRLFPTPEDTADICGICMCNYESGDLLRKLRCKHKFHRKCIDLWIVKTYKCPNCRATLTETDTVTRGTRVLPKAWEQIKNDCLCYIVKVAARAAAITDARRNIEMSGNSAEVGRLNSLTINIASGSIQMDGPRSIVERIDYQ